VGPHASSPAATSRAEKGLRLFSVNGRRFGVVTAVHVLTFRAPQYQVRIALAHHALDGGRQTPRAMCRATHACVAAVNGDYFVLTHPGAPDPGDEVGGIIQNCVLLHTPEVSHQQANLDGRSVTQGLDWSDVIDVHGTFVPVTAINQERPLSYANVHIALSGTLLFSAPYALTTPRAPGWVTYEFTRVAGPVQVTTINTTSRLVLRAVTTRALRVRAGDVDVSAPSGSALSSLRVGQSVTTRTSSRGGCNDIGGHPILLDQGVATPIVAADTYMARPYARTVIGWTASGRTVLMTVDGVDGVSGATASQLVALLRLVHVVTALDLDGGNSTTLYARGRTINRPSRGVERRVSTSLVVLRG
jgi:exopolysaccharide biosynthesis protein